MLRIERGSWSFLLQTPGSQEGLFHKTSGLLGLIALSGMCRSNGYGKRRGPETRGALPPQCNGIFFFSLPSPRDNQSPPHTPLPLPPPPRAPRPPPPAPSPSPPRPVPPAPSAAARAARRRCDLPAPPIPPPPPSTPDRSVSSSSCGRRRLSRGRFLIRRRVLI